MNSHPNKYQEQVMNILTKVNTKMWVFYRPPLPTDIVRKEEKSTSGFRIIHGNFLISFR